MMKHTKSVTYNDPFKTNATAAIVFKVFTVLLGSRYGVCS